MSDVARILAVLALVGANALFVIGEYAIVTARRAALAPRAEAGSGRARAALRLMDDPVRVMSTVQVGITAVGILTGAIGEPFVQDLLGGGLPRGLSFLISFTLVTYLSTVLGELVPKALALERAETFATLVAPAIELMSVALRPVVWVLQVSARAILRPFGVHDVVAGESIRSPDELRAVVDEAERAGIIEPAQEELLHNAFEFVDREVRDIMVPALDVDWLDADMTPDSALDRVIEAPHERYPVARGSLDRLIGVVHVRDLLAAARSRQAATVGELARPAMVVPETKDLGALLREMREQREQLAIVVDEYGGAAGIVTLEDLLEELVGDIQDEFDLPDARLTWLDDRTVRAAGSMTIDDFNETVGTHLPQRGPRTLAGLVLHELGRRPNPGDTVTLDGVTIRVEAVDGLRVSRLLVVVARGAARDEQLERDVRSLD
jgi:magnesium and cobalt exporter, CNNM family